MADAPSFDEFYRAVHGRPPFPWQERLAERVAERGWPTAIAIPTGMGKTAAIDIGVWALAAQADLDAAARTAPTRIWYVVNRRLLVDAGAAHAERLRAVLDAPDAPTAVRDVARRLSGIHQGPPLWVSRFRGGTDPWLRPPSPAQPAVLCATVPMFGSRFLFRAYGTGRGMWPVDAALAGTDAVILLDESHLSPALTRLLDQAVLCDANRAGVLRPFGRGRPSHAEHVLPPARARAVLVELSATGSRGGDRFELDADDRAHPVIAQRLAAAKLTDVLDVAPDQLVPTIATACRERLAALGGGVALVFVNRPRTARAVARALDGPDFDLEVLTGQLRDVDADDVRARLLDPAHGAPAGRPAVLRSRPLVIVATQTLEVGADLDVDVLVTEAAGVRALVQRFGRLNRLGERPWARGAIVFTGDSDPLYPGEAAAVRERLGAGPVDLGPGHIAGVLGEPTDRPRGHLPELLPNHLWEFAKTSPAPRDAAPPELFFAGMDERDLTVSVAWRAILPVDGSALSPPLHTAEAVEVPLAEARQALATIGPALRVSPDGGATEPVDSAAIRPGDRIVLCCSSGGYGAQGWDPDSRSPVRDVSPALRHELHLTPDALVAAAGGACLGDDVTACLDGLVLVDVEDDEPPRLVVDSLPDAVASWLREHGILAQDAIELAVTLPPNSTVPVLKWRRARVALPAPRIDALDELSVVELRGLTEHLAGVGAVAARFASLLGMPDHLVAAVRQAGELHDLGKADRRFQRWLGNTEAATPIAKSMANADRWEAARVAASWPKGGRHELLSEQLVDALVAAGFVLVDGDLVRHLVLSHHGHGRPGVPAPGSSSPLRTQVTVDSLTVEARTDPGAPALDQPERFRRLCERFGYWQLALLEATVRQADHFVSAVTEVE